MADLASGTRQASPTFEEAEGLGPRDEEFVRDLVALLERHGNLDRFGLCLLHEHFQLARDEVLVETNDPRTRTLTTRVVKSAETAHVKPSQWRFRRSSGPEGVSYEAVLQCNPASGCPGRDGDAR